MKVRVQANGEVHGTKVLTADGTDLSDNVSAVRFTHVAGQVPRIDVGLLLAPADVEGRLRFYFIDPRDGAQHEVRRIEYADGGSFEPAAGENYQSLVRPTDEA